MSALAHSWWRYDTSECRGVWYVVCTGAGEGSCGVVLRRRAACGDMTRLRVEVYGRR